MIKTVDFSHNPPCFSAKFHIIPNLSMKSHCVEILKNIEDYDSLLIHKR